MVSGTLSALSIRDEPNAELRRELIAMYNRGDSARYLRDIGASVIHSDVDQLGNPRRLLAAKQEGDEDYVAIEVTNSTPEPDGTRKVYTARCDPGLRPLKGIGGHHEDPKAQKMTCHNAIASTYGWYGHEYLPLIET